MWVVLPDNNVIRETSTGRTKFCSAILAKGGGGFVMLVNKPMEIFDRTIPDILMEYIKEMSPIYPLVENYNY